MKRLSLIGVVLLSAGLSACRVGIEQQVLPPGGTPPLPTSAGQTGTPVPSAAAGVESGSAIQQENTPVNETNTPGSGTANADVTFVRAVLQADGTWTFYVTVEHPDTGWEDYADGWDVVLPDGTIVKPDPESPFTRLLLHPHVGEQPFTRSQSQIVIPDGVTQVTVRAHDLVDGFGGREVVVDLTAGSGADYQVER